MKNNMMDQCDGCDQCDACGALDDYCDRCETDFFLLIDRLVNDVQRLISKVVCLRYSLSWYLGRHEGEMLRCDVLSDLHGDYYEQSVYQRFVSACYDGQDPMECEHYIDNLLKLSNGVGTVDF